MTSYDAGPKIKKLSQMALDEVHPNSSINHVVANGSQKIIPIEKRAKKNITTMVIMISIVYTIGTIAYATYFGIKFLFKSGNKLLVDYLREIGITFVYALI
ncbi:unnamed protein product, partial [Brachionus calyciflorus]